VGTGTLEIISQPPGATTYVDDEPVGATDPQTGRLVKTGLPPGRHHVRLTRAAYEDAVGDVDVARGEAAVFHATLAPLPAGSPVAGAGLVVFALVAIGLVAVFAWMALRRPEAPSLSGESTHSGGPAVRPATPSGQANPGARSDAAGQEWFGDYRLREMLGRGGMASVYKAERCGELSALKRHRHRARAPLRRHDGHRRVPRHAGLRRAGDDRRARDRATQRPLRAGPDPFRAAHGAAPFTGESSFAILKKHSSQEPPTPSRLQKAVPPELDAIVLKLLRKDLADRPESAEDLVVALRDWLNRAA
jgi:hypothetical protein